MASKHASNTKMKTKGAEKDLADLANKIDETDEMKLKMLALDKPSSDDILYPAELNAHLIEQLKIMTSENNELRKSVFTKDQDIKELNATVTKLNQQIRDIISGTGPALSCKSAGIISAKLTDLCKQNRCLIADIEGFKTRNSALERKIMQLEIIKEKYDKLDACTCKDEPYDPHPEELKDLNNKLAAVNKKLYESKNRNLELKNEIITATKILQQELGDKFTSIKELQNDMAGWKGRAQQITLLQAKVADLEEKLYNKTKLENPDGKKKDQAQIIRDLELKRKKEIEQSIKEVEGLKEENKELKKKLDGARCRVRNLECDVTTIRQKMQTFVEKSGHDDLLINEQRNQIKTSESYYQEILKENNIKMNKMIAEIAEFKKLTANTETKIEAMRKQTTDKATKIEELRAQLLRYEECSLQSVFFTPMKTARDNEIKTLSELVVTLNTRLDAEREKWEQLETTNRKLKERKKKLERRLGNLEEEIKSLRDMRLRSSKASKVGVDGSLTKKSSTIAATDKTSEDTSTESQPSHEQSLEDLDKDELKYKLELTEEKLKIMEDRLKMVEEEKQYDYDHLTDMIQTSKQLFNEALAALQKEKCHCELSNINDE